MTASLWFTDDGIAPKTGASVACEVGEESAARVRKASGRAIRSIHGFRGACSCISGGGSFAGDGFLAFDLDGILVDEWPLLCCRFVIK